MGWPNVYTLGIAAFVKYLIRLNIFLWREICFSNEATKFGGPVSVWRTHMAAHHKFSASRIAALAGLLACLVALPASAAPFFFSTGNPDGRMATASRPASAGKLEIESADDFVLGSTTQITGASFIGLLPTGLQLSGISRVVVEIYRVFPLDSTIPPSGSVPTRANSPSDTALDSRDSSLPNLSFTASILNNSFTASNSVVNGINKSLTPFTGGEGAVTGEEVSFNINFLTPFLLGADHYFFVPQVKLTSGDFLWLSAPRPIVAPGTPFAPGTTDLQSWIRNGNLDPDWLRVGTDITHEGPFNAAFSLTGSTVPEPASLALFVFGLAGLAFSRRKS